jgi:hypothetical protein
MFVLCMMCTMDLYDLYTCMYLNIIRYVCMYACMYVCMYVCTNVCMCNAIACRDIRRQEIAERRKEAKKQQLFNNTDIGPDTFEQACECSINSFAMPTNTNVHMHVCIFYLLQT